MLLAMFFNVPMMEFLSVRHNAKTIQTELAQSGIEVQKEDAFKAAVKIGRGMKKYHIYLGFAISILILLRLVFMFLDNPKDAGVEMMDGRRKFARILYAVFYAALIVICTTGLIMYFGKGPGRPSETIMMVKEIHEAMFPILLIFTVLHIVGTVFAECKYDKGIIRKIITGSRD
jgi:cytochrome b561